MHCLYWNLDDSAIVAYDAEPHCKGQHVSTPHDTGDWNTMVHVQMMNGSPLFFLMLVKYSVPAPIEPFTRKLKSTVPCNR